MNFKREDFVSLRRRLTERFNTPLLLELPLFILDVVDTTGRATMTEQQWMTSEDPTTMVDFIHNTLVPPDGRLAAVNNNETLDTSSWKSFASARKLRLFACACCRQVWDGTKCPDCVEGMVLHHPTDLPFSQSSASLGDCERCQGSGRVGGLTDPRSRKAVEVAEKYADGLATREELSAARTEAAAARNWGNESPEFYPQWIAHVATCIGPESIVSVATRQTELGRLIPPAVQASLLRDIFSPFTAVVREGWQTCWTCNGEGKTWTTLNDGVDCLVCHGKGRVPSAQLARWLAWNDGCVGKMAQVIYDERRFNDLPLLADALEEADCEDATILSHLRGTDKRCSYCGEGGDWYPPPCPECVKKPPIHVRGCWVIDLLLGKQ